MISEPGAAAGSPRAPTASPSVLAFLGGGTGRTGSQGGVGVPGLPGRSGGGVVKPAQDSRSQDPQSGRRMEPIHPEPRRRRPENKRGSRSPGPARREGRVSSYLLLSANKSGRSPRLLPPFCDLRGRTGGREGAASWGCGSRSAECPWAVRAAPRGKVSGREWGAPWRAQRAVTPKPRPCCSAKLPPAWLPGAGRRTGRPSARSPAAGPPPTFAWTRSS